MIKKSEILSGKKILFVSSTEFGHRTREFREAMTLHNAGADVTVYGYSAEVPDLWANSPIKTEVYIPETRGIIASENPIWAVRVFMNLTVNVIRRAVRKYTARKVEMHRFILRGASYKPVVVHAMDLPSLAHAAKIAKKANAKLVYDSSEYWIGFMENEVWKSCGYLSLDYLSDERANIHKADIVLTTSPTMSRKLEQDYNIHKFCCLYNAPVLNGFIPDSKASESGLKLVFHGGVGPDRNLDGLFEAIAKLPDDVSLDVYGNLHPVYEKPCLEHVNKLGLSNRVTFHGKYDYGEMLDFLQEYDVGVYPAKAEDGNFDVTLPNKVFDCICAGIALLVPDFISMRELMDHARCGVCVHTANSDDIADAILDLRNNKDKLKTYKERAKAISREYSWEAQEGKLICAYEGLIGA